MNRASDTKEQGGVAVQGQVPDCIDGASCVKVAEGQQQSDLTLQSSDNKTIDELIRDPSDQPQHTLDEVTNTAQHESLLLSPEELTPIELGDFLLPIDQHETDFLGGRFPKFVWRSGRRL